MRPSRWPGSTGRDSIGAEAPLDALLLEDLEVVLTRKRRLDAVSVPRPCPASWASMAGTDKARLCADCGREVHNLSALTRAEVESLLNRDERLCVTLCRHPDGSVATADRALRPLRVSVATAAVMSACLAPTPVRASPAQDSRVQSGPTAVVSGVVRDYQGESVAARIDAVNEATKATFTTRADNSGHYSLVLPPGHYRFLWHDLTSCTMPDVAVRHGQVRIDAHLPIYVLGEVVARPCAQRRRNPVVNTLTAPLRAIKRLFASTR